MDGNGSCKTFEEKLTAYVLEELEEAEKESLEAHVAACPACASDVELLRSTVEKLQATRVAAYVLEADRRQLITLEATAAVTPQRRRWARLRSRLAAAAAIAMLLAIGIFLTFEYGVPATQLARRDSARPAAEKSVGYTTLGGDASTSRAPRSLRSREPEEVADMFGLDMGSEPAAPPDMSVTAEPTASKPTETVSVAVDKARKPADSPSMNLQLAGKPAMEEAIEIVPGMMEKAERQANDERELLRSKTVARLQVDRIPQSASRGRRPEIITGRGSGRTGKGAESTKPAPSRSRSPQSGLEGIARLKLANVTERFGRESVESLEEKRRQEESEERLKIQVELMNQGLDRASPGVDIPARIVGVRGDLAMLSVGRDDGVKPGMVFAVSRGATYVGDVRVRTVYKDMAGAESMYLVDGAEIREGDTARTKHFGRTAAEPAVTSPDQQVEEILRSLAQRPGESPDMMFFRYYGDNPFVEAGAKPLSTFSVDVDTASYTLARSYLTRGVVPPKEAVRTEEFINYFKGGYPAPAEGDFAIHTELAPSPFGHEKGYKLLRIGVKGREVPLEKRRPCALVFVIDVSGSMGRENRLELVKNSLRYLVGRLDERDTIGIVTFWTTAQKVLDPVGVDRSEKILRTIDGLSAGGSTNAGDGILLGYEMAAAGFLKGGNNRVILLSDGVANTGVTDPDQILKRVQQHRRENIFLNSIGVGMGNHNDVLLERLADAGDGQCVYVDRLEEARKVFSEHLMGTLETIAKDVKIQVAFDTEHVVLYRQLGYENRALKDEDFRNDAVDAGEIGAGHEVTALYEVLPLAGAKGRLATVTVRYKPVAGSTVEKAVEIAADVTTDKGYPDFLVASPRFRLCAVVAEFAEILRRSYWARGSTLDSLLYHAGPLAGSFSEERDVGELIALIKQTRKILVQTQPQDELAQAVEAIKENYILSARLAQLEKEEGSRELELLRQQNEKLKRTIREILERRVRR